MRISDAIVKYLELNDVEYIFGVPAGTVSPIYDAINDFKITPIVTKNEAGAAYSATRYASMCKKLGVCVVGGAVGINNMVNGIADAMRTKTPMLVISGLVHRWQLGKGAIQELETSKIFRPITKYSYTVMEEEKVLEELKKAIELAMTPPCGPVHLCIPVDVQSLPFIGELPKKSEDHLHRYLKVDYAATKKAVDLINSEASGIIMVGKGCRGLTQEVMELSTHLQWPIITTPEGKGVIPGDFELNLGNYGFSGTDAADNYVEKGSGTCLLVLGSSLGEPSTGNFSNLLVAGRKVIHVDLDIRELDKVFKTDIKINSDLGMTIRYILNNTTASNTRFIRPALNAPYTRNHTGLSTRLFIEKVQDILPANTSYVCDVGEYMNFVFKYLTIKAGGEFEVSINYGAMGSCVGGAAGVYLANPQNPVVVFVGDGSFFMNGMEILSVKEYNMPIIYVVINNAMLGYVEHGHSFLYGRSTVGFKQQRVSISDMAKSLGIDSMEINTLEDIDNINSFISNLNGPCVIEAIIDGSEPAPILGRLKALKKVNA